MPIFMQYDGILGLATGKRKGWIELESCQWEQNRDVTNRSRRIEGIRAPSSSEIVVTHFQDAISPQLFRESIEGTRKKATIEFGNEPDPGHLQMYLRIELVNTMISSISSSTIGGSGKPTESISLNFTKATFSYDPNGASAAGPTHPTPTAVII